MASCLPRGLDAAMPSRMIVQPALRNVEGFVDGHSDVLAFRAEFRLPGDSFRVNVLRRIVQAGVVRDDDLLSRHGEINPYVIPVARFVTTLREPHEHAAPRDPAVVGFELADARENLGLESRPMSDASECHRGCELHVGLSIRAVA
jgi:hypothetical protein